MIFKIVRITEVLNTTLGEMLIDDEPFCRTLELAWLENQRGVSCIPTGFYTCKRVNSPRFGNTFEVTDVPNRSLILFHTGNTFIDTEGCIILGNVFGKLEGMPGVFESRRAFNNFLDATRALSSFDLIIG